MALLLKKYLSPTSDTPRILEIGAGTGSNVPVLSSFGAVTIIEPSAFAVERIREISPTIQCFTSTWPDAAELVGRFDAVLLLDVLEHIDDDRASLHAVLQHLNPSGIVLLTVPAYRSMWSMHDEVLWHKRRYSPREFRTLLRATGLEILEYSGFNWVLLPIAWVLRKLRFGPAIGEKRLPGLLNWLLFQILRCEVFAMRCGFRPNFGLTVVAVCRGTSQ